MSSHRSGCEILCIGTELLLGNILNGNARWLAEALAGLGIPHFRQGVVGDNPERLRDAVLEAAGRSAFAADDDDDGAEADLASGGRAAAAGVTAKGAAAGAGR